MTRTASAYSGRMVALLATIAAGTIVVDQATKAIAVVTLEGLPRAESGPTVPVLGQLAGFSFYRNPGAAFGMGENTTWLFTAIAIAALIAVIVLMRRLRHRGWAVGLGLLLGGLLGNLIDRLVRPPGFFHGAVVDFIDLRVFICNVADIALTAAAVTLILLSLRGVGLDGRIEGAEASAREEQPMSRERSILVPDGLEGERVDVALSRLLGLSRSAAAQLASDGEVSVDGQTVAKSERLLAGSRLDVTMPAPPEPLSIVAEPVEGMRIVHDDDSIVVVDKPVGVAAHSAAGWSGPTVIGGLAAAGYRIATSGAAERQGIVHRLDVGTSGLMAVAKSERAYSVLKRAFKARTVKKTYHALVQGHPDPLEGTIEAPIGRHPRHDGLYAVVSDGKHAVTHYEVLEAHRRASLLSVDLQTGRTHQIRVHMSAMKHPCAGDLSYGADPRLAERLGLERQWLHAMSLGFHHPEDGSWVEFSSTYPEDLANALERVRTID